MQMMGSVEGMDQHVRTWEAQAYENSRGIEASQIRSYFSQGRCFGQRIANLSAPSVHSLDASAFSDFLEPLEISKRHGF